MFSRDHHNFFLSRLFHFNSTYLFVFKFIFNTYLFLIYLFGCVGSWLQHTGSFFLDAQVSLVVGRVGSVVAVSQLSCPNACGILVPQPGTEFMFLALEGGFITTGPPGKSLH